MASQDSRSSDVELQHQLIKLIVERVHIQGEWIVGLTLKSDFHVVLGHNKNEPTYVDVEPFLGHYTHIGTEGVGHPRVYRVKLIPPYLKRPNDKPSHIAK